PPARLQVLLLPSILLCAQILDLYGFVLPRRTTRRMQMQIADPFRWLCEHTRRNFRGARSRTGPALFRRASERRQILWRMEMRTRAPQPVRLGDSRRPDSWALNRQHSRFAADMPKPTLGARPATIKVRNYKKIDS